MSSIKKSISQWRYLKGRIERREEKLKAIKDEFNAVEQGLIEQMEDQGFESVKTKAGTFFIQETLYSSINKTAFEEAKKFFDDQGILPELITENFRKSRLNEFIKDQLKKGQVIPDFVKYYIKKWLGSRINPSELNEDNPA